MAAQKFFFIGSGFVCGIIIAAFYSLSFVTFYLIALTTFVASAILFQRYLFLVSLGLIGLFLGILYFDLRSDYLNAGYPKDGSGSFEVIAKSESQITDRSQRFSARFEGGYSGDVLVFYSADERVLYGQRFKVEGEFESAERPGSLPVIFVNDLKVSGIRSGGLGRQLHDFKVSLVDVLIRNLSPRSGALAAGLLLGEKANFDADFKEAMRRSGTTHIVALSGYNISVLVGALAFLVSAFRRRTRMILYIISIVFFTLMVGAEPSIVRAAIMGGLFLISKEFGRDIPPGYALVFAGLGMLLWNPMYVYSVGFQLSFLSFAGIVYLMPAISVFLKIKNSLFSNLVLESGSAQLAVLPLVVGYFGGFSMLAILANILILWAVPIAMFFTFCLLVFNFIFPPIVFFVNWICEIILGYQIMIIDLFSKLYIPSGESFKSGLFVAVYVFVVLAFIIINRQDKIDEPNQA
mgnify:CR=1 FL=1